MKIRLLVLLPLGLLSGLCFGSTPEIKDLHRLLSQLPIEVDRIPSEPSGIAEAGVLMVKSSGELKAGKINREEITKRVLALAESGNAIAKYLYSAKALKDGKSSDAIQNMLSESAQQGCAAAATIKGLHELSNLDIKSGLSWLHLAAVKGDTSAQVYLAELYIKGGKIVDINEPLACAWIRVAQRQIEQVPTSTTTMTTLLNLTMQTDLSKKGQDQSDAIYAALKEEVDVAPQHMCSHAEPYRRPRSTQLSGNRKKTKAEVIREEMETASYSESELMSLLSQGKRVFVYFTADWCVTCKANEHSALYTKKTQAFFEENNITLLVGDYTDTVDSITTVLELYEHPGVPLYLYFQPGDNLTDGHKLPQILPSPNVIISNIQDLLEDTQEAQTR